MRFSTLTQRNIFLAASGLSTAGSFAGITAKSWLLFEASDNPFLIALNFGLLALPTILISGIAGILTDRRGSEFILRKAQWGLFYSGLLGALSIFFMKDSLALFFLLMSTLMIGIAGSFEQTARNKYCALLVDKPEELASYLSSFSVTFNLGKLIGPALGGWLVAFLGPGFALSIDSASYLIPIFVLNCFLKPNKSNEECSVLGQESSLIYAFKAVRAPIRYVLIFTGLSCLIGFFHPGLAPLIADEVLGHDPRDLGLFTSILAAGSVAGGLFLQRNSNKFFRRPFLTLSGFAIVTALAQLVMSQGPETGISLVMIFFIGLGTAGLLSSCNLITQLGSPQVLRGRMAGLSQIAFLGGGGISGLLAAWFARSLGLPATFAISGIFGFILAIWIIFRQGRIVLRPSD